MVCLFCWIALRRRLLTPVLVLENVPQFPFSMLQRFLPMYKLDDAIIDNEVTLGLSISRTRRYCIAILVLYYHLERPLSQLDSCLGRSRGGSHSWRDYFVADTPNFKQSCPGVANANPAGRMAPQLAQTDRSLRPPLRIHCVRGNTSTFKVLDSLAVDICTCCHKTQGASSAAAET